MSKHVDLKSLYERFQHQVEPGSDLRNDNVIFPVYDLQE